jgi:hypothetical protein
LSKYTENALESGKEFICYVRYIGKGGILKLFEVRGKPYYAAPDTSPGLVSQLDTSPSGMNLVILCAREYASKSSQSLDGIVELQIETLRLQHELENLIRARGKDPRSHHLLVKMAVEMANDNPDDLTESFLYTTQEVEKSLTSPAPVYDSFESFLIPASTAPLPNVNNPNPPHKKRKVTQNVLFCLQCGTTKSPEWRTGQEGPKTLCNACGLAFYKKNKKLASAQKKKL